tara:strand:+ start:1406 stop:1882 length:477 start_codon:yes stop_codon:yes gene_type:complete
MKAKKESIKYHTEVINGVLHMECRRCGQMTPCSPDASSVMCSECVRELYEKDFPFEPASGYKPTGRPRGWAFMKEYVDKDGNVFHKGKEQPKLKGTLPPTVIKPKPKKKKLTKAQKQRIKADAFAKIHLLKKDLKKAKFKKDIKKINSEIKKLQKLTK